MIVVSDTTPIISLILIEQLELLEKLFHNVYIPMGVYEELTEHPLYSMQSETVKNCSFIKPVSVKDLKSVDIFRKATGLDKGESEAIVLSEEINADILLMDEKKGRKIATQMGLTITGTLGILLNAYKENMIAQNEIINCVDKLKNNKIYISDYLHNAVLLKIHENNL